MSPAQSTIASSPNEVGTKAVSASRLVNLASHFDRQEDQASGMSSRADSGAGPLGPVFRVIPGLQSYDWGILGKDGSSVAKYAFEGTGAELLDVQYDEKKPYAEVSSKSISQASRKLTVCPILL